MNTIEIAGITKSPLDAFRYRGNRISGVTDNNAYEPSLKQREQKLLYIDSVSVPLVPGIDYEILPTITKKLSMTESELEDLIKKARSISPCPCKSKECDEDYKEEKLKLETLIKTHKCKLESSLSLPSILQG